jgi:hypothetical protein
MCRARCCSAVRRAHERNLLAGDVGACVNIRRVVAVPVTPAQQERRVPPLLPA